MKENISNIHKSMSDIKEIPGISYKNTPEVQASIIKGINLMVDDYRKKFHEFLEEENKKVNKNNV